VSIVVATADVATVLIKTSLTQRHYIRASTHGILISIPIEDILRNKTLLA
jgi:hypothetical protein